MNQKPLTSGQVMVSVSAKERKLLDELRKVPYGRVEVFMEKGQPDHIVQIRETVKL